MPEPLERSLMIKLERVTPAISVEARTDLLD